MTFVALPYVGYVVLFSLSLDLQFVYQRFCMEFAYCAHLFDSSDNMYSLRKISVIHSSSMCKKFEQRMSLVDCLLELCLMHD